MATASKSNTLNLRFMEQVRPYCYSSPKQTSQRSVLLVTSKSLLTPLLKLWVKMEVTISIWYFSSFKEKSFPDATQSLVDLTVPARNIPVFRAGKRLKGQLNN